MTKDFNKPPYHWRAGNGYIPPLMLNKIQPQQPGPFFAPVPFAMPPPGHGFVPCGPPPGYMARPLAPPPLVARPPQCPVKPAPRGVAPPGRDLPKFKFACGPPPTCYKVKVKPAPTIASVTDSADSDAESTVTATSCSSSSTSSSASSSASSSSRSSEATLVVEKCKVKVKETKCCKSACKCDKAKSDKSNGGKSKDESSGTSVSGAKLPGGLRKGIGYLYTGKPCNLHIIDGSKISLDRLVDTDKKSKPVSFRIFRIQDNSSIAELITAMGGEDKASVTQVWEWGEGRWKKGSKMTMGGEKADRRLSELGWSEAGSKKKQPVWLYFAKK